jgi:hypothetical protein
MITFADFGDLSQSDKFFKSFRTAEINMLQAGKRRMLLPFGIISEWAVE